MPFQETRHDLTDFVEAWISDLIGASVDAPIILMPDDAGNNDIANVPTSARTPKRPRRVSNKQGGSAEDDATPRPREPLLLLRRRRSRQQRDTFSDRASETDSITTSTASTATSGRSSPRKKELALRRTVNYPVQRLDITTFDGLPPPLLQLVTELYRIGQGETGIIPDIFAASMRRDAGLFNSLPDRWFCRPDPHDEGTELEYRHRRLQIICQNSKKCARRMEHEPGWNDQVHSPILSEALESRRNKGVDVRNITLSRIHPHFRDTDPALQETKIDYGIFLQPPEQDELAQRINVARRHLPPVTHLSLSDDAPSPLAVSIETKSLLAAAVDGPSQLANWVRAHFRQLAEVAAFTQEITPDEDNDLNAAHRDASDATPDNTTADNHDGALQVGGHAALPILPLVFVYGNVWRVDFAQRAHGKTLIYESVPIGDTHTLHGCYQVYRAIQRLADWAETEFYTWWLDATNGAVSVPSGERGYE
ncbi:hypothetical protein HD806DRAFT_516360 [Xylariaceae sp. AK1471]|nr:hypothetical protein HD806DRAFT_516360 [Xylariaceae sp. AK1471]